jgi:succinate-semialdehyde dehydrogenase/glutarate-semialdehyde dehydrogenase
MAIASINPATGETLKTFDSLTEHQLEQKLARAAETFRSYKTMAFEERERLMLRAADILNAEKKRFARLMTMEMGKPIKGAVQEVEKCALVCRYYADNAKHHLADELVVTRR